MASDALICNRHGRAISGEHEYCWYCHEFLCYECWDFFGDCGHPEVEEFYEETERRKKEGLPLMSIPSA